MSNPLPFILTSENLTLTVSGKEPIIIAAGTVQYRCLREAILRDDWTSVEYQLSPAGSLAIWLGDNPLFAVSEQDRAIVYKGWGKPERLPASIEARVWEMANNGESPKALFAFYERLQKNPSYRSVHQLYEFLKHRNLPIEEDGTFLTYKGVRGDFKDVHSGTFDNSPGRTHSMPRNKISDDQNVECDEGFHVGALGYVQWFLSDHNDGRVMICRVDPEHVVSVPRDHHAQKIRVCKYTVVGFYTQPMPSTTVTKNYTTGEDAAEDAAAEEREEIAAGGAGTAEDDDINDGWDAVDDAVDGSYEDDHERGSPADNMVAPSDIDDDLKAEVGDVIADMHRISHKKGGARKHTAPTRHKLGKMKRMTAKQLMEESIDHLRFYAGKLKVVGASKLAGGKTALVNHILNARGARRKR